MFEKVIEFAWRMKMPKKYRDSSDEEIYEDYVQMRKEMMELFEAKHDDMDELLEFVKKYEDLIYAIDILDRKYFHEMMSRK